MKKTRVLVVEDSLTVRKHIVEVLSADTDIEVVGEAADGKRGIELCQALRPDAVTCDMMMPVMTGLAAVEYIMAYCPTPILIVSSSTNRGELFKTYEALTAGALDVLDKPTGGEIDTAWEQRLVSTVKLIARIKVITHPRGRLGSVGLRALDNRIHASTTPSAQSVPSIAAIGVSTGGPAALVQILQGLPRDFPIPLVIVMHLSKMFAPAFAEWLDQQSPIRVRYAQDGERVPELGESRVVMAPADVHLLVERGKFRLAHGPERHSCRPAVDNLFESLAREVGGSCVAALLTGMGRDGAAGLLALRHAGARTIAQDEATSVVFGMPREAIELGGAGEILPLEKIAPRLVELASGWRPA